MSAASPVTSVGYGGLVLGAAPFGAPLFRFTPQVAAITFLLSAGRSFQLQRPDSPSAFVLRRDVTVRPVNRDAT